MPRLPYAEARDAVRRLGITTAREYWRRYTEVPGLPSAPHKTYAEWTTWAAFLAPHLPRFVPYDEAVAAIHALGIQSPEEYRQRYRDVPGLPSTPQATYPAWPGWSVVLGASAARRIRRPSIGLPEAQARARALGLTRRAAYKAAAITDQRLPRLPQRLPGWPGWAAFLNVDDPDTDVLPYEAARAAVRGLGVRTSLDYVARYREVPGLPSSPARAYRNEWQGFPAFLGPTPSKYVSYTEANAAAVSAGWRTARDYRSQYRTIPGLPSMPEKIYASEWTTWQTFLSDQHLSTVRLQELNSG